MYNPYINGLNANKTALANFKIIISGYILTTINVKNIFAKVKIDDTIATIYTFLSAFNNVVYVKENIYCNINPIDNTNVRTKMYQYSYPVSTKIG